MQVLGNLQTALIDRGELVPALKIAVTEAARERQRAIVAYREHVYAHGAFTVAQKCIKPNATPIGKTLAPRLSANLFPTSVAAPNGFSKNSFAHHLTGNSYRT
jgi:hypothetical protein